MDNTLRRKNIYIHLLILIDLVRKMRSLLTKVGFVNKRNIHLLTVNRLLAYSTVDGLIKELDIIEDQVTCAMIITLLFL